MASFRLNPALGAELERSPLLQARLRAAADLVAGHARQLAEQHGAPWMENHAEPDLIVVIQEGVELSVLNTDYGGGLMEFGSKNNPPFAPLRRAVRAAGLDFKAARPAR